MITKFFLDKVKKNKRKQIQKVKYHAFIKDLVKDAPQKCNIHRHDTNISD